MKRRDGFVSNSSSSSFAIRKKDLTADQIYKIRHHSEEGKWLNMEFAEDAWEIRQNGRFIFGDTAMDNFDMFDFLARIGVPSSVIRSGK